MKSDGVSIAFELISDEIDSVANKIAQDGAKAFQELRHTDAKNLAESGEALQTFRSKVENLLDDWQGRFNIEVREQVEMKEITSIPKSTITRSSRNRLLIEFPDGTRFDDHIAADAFAAAIKHIGFERVISVGIRVRGLDLVGETYSSTYQQRRIQKYWIVTHSSTDEKYDSLIQMNKKLNLGIKVTIIEPKMDNKSQ